MMLSGEKIADLRRALEHDAILGFEGATIRTEDLRVVLDDIDALRKALEPFSVMAGEMFARGWDASNVALGLYYCSVTVGDFFEARRLITQEGGKS